jgi:hypothetical protein
MILEEKGLAVPVLDIRTPSTPGTGITTGVGTVYRQTVYKMGDVVKTEIYLNLKGLNSSTAGDIIGKDATANCHLGQITTAKHGKLHAGRISCLTAPATGEPDIDVVTLTIGTGTEDVAASGLTGYVLRQDHAADYTAQGHFGVFTTVPAPNDYLYLVGSGGGDAATYTAGEFLIELWGYDV